MAASRRRLRRLAWGAWLAIAGIVFAPTISRLTLAGPEAIVGAAHAPSAMHDAMSMAAEMAAMHESMPSAEMSAVHGAMSMAAEMVAMHGGMSMADPMAAMHSPSAHSHDTTPAGDPPLPAHSHTLDHCGLCAVAAAAFAFTASAPTLTRTGEVERAPVRAAAPAVRLRLEWSPASSRGPPLVA